LLTTNKVPAASVSSGASAGAGASTTTPAAGTSGTSAVAAASPVVSAFQQQPYSPLEQEGRDIYVSEGCYNCHSQMIRPFRHETLRYGEYSRLEEFTYDRPFQWGSKRTGPDLHRVGGKYPNLWHYQHMRDPRSIAPASNMPPYEFLARERVDFSRTGAKLKVLQRLGTPYSSDEISWAAEIARSQASLIAQDLEEQGVTVDPQSRLVAIIAYLQRLGRRPQPTGWVPVERAGAEGGD